MKQRARVRRIKRQIGKYPAMVLPRGWWFLEVPPSVAYDLAQVPDHGALWSVVLRRGQIERLDPMPLEDPLV